MSIYYINHAEQRCVFWEWWDSLTPEKRAYLERTIDKEGVRLQQKAFRYANGEAPSDYCSEKE